jgi:hemoglobin-like flavoprotein
VQESFKKVQPIAQQAADLFYNRLFEIAPQARPLFPADLKEQKRKLMAMLATVVTNLHQVDRIAPAVQDLRRRHAGYGMTAEHYKPPVRC